MSDVLSAVVLSSLPKVGPRTYQRLVRAFGSAQDAAFASPEDHETMGILNTTQIEKLMKAVRDLPKLEAWLDELTFEGISVRTQDTHDYPEVLHRYASAPPVLYTKGELPPDEEPAVAVVGTRSATEEGLAMAHGIAAELARAGILVASGLALGVDTAGHEGALDGEGRTLAILGSGLLRIHPQENADLADRITQQGALISECFPTERTSVSRLMARNRLQVAFSRAIIVVEMGDTKGSMAAVDQAGKQGRPVFAWYTERDCPQAQGPRSLVEGKLARPIRSADDLQDVLEAVETWQPPELSDDTDEVNPQLRLF